MKKYLRIVLLLIAAVIWVAGTAAFSEETADPSLRFPLNTYTPTPPPTPTPVPTPVPTPTPTPKPLQEISSGEPGGYRIIIEDTANLLSAEDEARVLEAMEALSAYGNVVFWSSNNSVSDPLLALQQYVDRNISSSLDVPSFAFSINMADRKMSLLSRGSLQSYVDSSEANAIRDRNTGYATRGDYGGCAVAIYEDVFNAVHGIYEFSAMRTICGVLLGLGIALLVVFLYTRKVSLQERGSVITLTLNRKYEAQVEVLAETKIRSSRKYRSQGSSGSSCSSCSSGSSCSSCSSGSSCSSCGSGSSGSF